MNILYLVPHVPNPTKIRSYSHISGLKNAEHQIVVATLQHGAKDAEYISRLEQMGIQVISIQITRQKSLINSLTILPSGHPLQFNFMWSAELMRRIEAQMRSNPPDIIHVEHLRMAKYGLLLKAHWPLVWDAVDNLESLFTGASQASTSRVGRFVARIEAPRLKHYEPWLVDQFLATLVISYRDQALFMAGSVSRREHIYVAPLGMPINPDASSLNRAPNVLLMTGAFNYHPNVASVVYFVREIFPKILRQRPDMKLQIVGANPSPAVEALQNIHIEVTGFVPSLSDYLHRATIALAPILYGSGIQVKVLEAFLTGTPLVATSVALRGLDVKHGEHVLIADTPDDFADAVILLLSDIELRNRIAAAGRRYIEQNHDLTKTTNQLLDVYEKVQDLYKSGAKIGETRLL